METKASDQLSHSPVRLGEPSPKHPPKLPDGKFSLGSAAVGAALSSVPLLETGRWLDLLHMADVCSMASWLTSVVQMLISELKGQSSGIRCTDPRVLP